MAIRPATAALPWTQRNPAMALAIVQAALSLIVTLGVPIADGWQALILSVTGAAVALLTGWQVAPTRPALIFGLLQAAAPIIVLAWANAPAGIDSAILTLAALLLGVGTRAQVSPAVVGPPFKR